MILGEDSRLYDVVVDVIIGVGILVNVYLVVDQLTDGELSRSISVRTLKMRHSVRNWWELENKFKHERPHVLFDAITTVEDAKNAE